MRLRALRSFLLPVLFAVALSPPPAAAQSPSDAELKALNARVDSLYQEGKYGDAIPLAERSLAGSKARYGENATEYALALSNLALLLKEVDRPVEADILDAPCA